MKSESNTVTKRNIVYQWQRDLSSAAEMKRANVVSLDQTPDLVAKNSQDYVVDESNDLSPAVNIIHSDNDNASPNKISILTVTRLLGRWVGTVINWLFPKRTIRKLQILRVSHPKKAKPNLREKIGLLPGVF